MCPTYPDIYYPQQYLAIRNNELNLIPLPSRPLAPVPPNEPQPFPIRLNLGIAAVTIVVSILSRSLIILGIMSLITMGVVGYCWLTYGKRRRSFEKEVVEYEQRLVEYQSELVGYEEERILHRDECFNLAQSQVFEFLRESSGPEAESNGTRRGRSEPYFESELRDYFPSNHIFTGQQMVLYPDYPYTADFCYYNPNINLYIDIEIDEPYTPYEIVDRITPIHTIDRHNRNENDRNRYFIDNGWFVIRFAEEQVMQEPYLCCQAIEDLIYDITGIEVTHHFRSENELTIIERWTWDEAYEMAENDYRQGYFP